MLNFDILNVYIFIYKFENGYGGKNQTTSAVRDSLFLLHLLPICT